MRCSTKYVYKGKDLTELLNHLSYRKAVERFFNSSKIKSKHNVHSYLPQTRESEYF